MSLLESEKRDLINLIEAGKPIPEKYRFLLFEDKKEVELVWNGKTSEVCNIVLPFQVIEQVDEPRKTTQEQADLFDFRGRQKSGWTNKLIWGDNKLILSSLKNGPLREEIERSDGIKLIYIDPPFDVGADFSMDIPIGEETLHKEPTILEELAYRDTWGKGADSFIAMIYERLVLMRDLLAEDGSIYVHCDWRVNSFIRLILDEVFGKDNFKNEIIWQKIRSSKSQSIKFGNVQDSIFFFSKNEQSIFNILRVPHADDYIQSHYRYVDEKTGKKYRLDNFTQTGQGVARQFGNKLLSPPQGKHWIWSQDRIDEGMKDGLIVFSKDNMPSVKRFLDEVGGNVIEDIWTDISPINSMSNERSDYPTQKPEALLERIIKASSNENDIVADFFCGSGTTASVAEKLNRKWITTDLGKFAVHTTRKRMIGVQREKKAAGKDFRAFEVLNLGKYERAHYVGINNDLRAEEKQKQIEAKEQHFISLILHAYKAQTVEGFTHFQGKKSGRLVAVGPINLPVTRLFVEEIILACRKNSVTKVDILAFEFEMGLFPSILEEAKSKGIDIAPKNIPRDVFDRRAIEKNQVVFHDVSYIEVKPHVKDNTVSVELTDFSVYYTQETLDSVAEGLKEGKNKITVDGGQIVKVRKDKSGIITREVLTKKWTDWIDYWSVDFNFENKREIIRIKNADTGVIEEQWTGDYIFENEWQSFRTKTDRTLELQSAFYEAKPGRTKIAVKVVDIFGNDTMRIIEVTIAGKK